MEVGKTLRSGSRKMEMTLRDFKRLSSFITQNFGIKMPETKMIMLQGRLQKRLYKLNIDSYSSYCDYLFTKGNEHEIINMIDVVSTNKTDFFREPQHFLILAEEILPEIINQLQDRTIKIWSAGCSSGEEPYTLAIVLSEFLAQHPNIDFNIFGSDISLSTLQHAVKAVYTEDRIIEIPLNLKRKYFLRSKDRANPTVKIVPEIRKKVSFDRINFMDRCYTVSDSFNAIFCRNALIYFDRDDQEKIIHRLCKHLVINGYFIIGHSESLVRMDIPLKQIKPTIFQKI